MNTPDATPDLLPLLAAVRAQVAGAAAIAVLHIGDLQTSLAVAGLGQAPEAMALGIGARTTATAHFRRDLPTPLELENAIATVEDEVMRARFLVATRPTLYTTDPALREMARLAGASGTPATLTLDAMESLFNRFSARVLGRPASQDGLPDTAAFAATLLILRECMHHLQFSTITCLDLPGPTA